MLRIAVVGLGKMGVSHLALLNAHPHVDVVAVCDSAGYVLDGLAKYTGLKTYRDYPAMLREAALDAVLIATPSSLHASMVKTALDRDLHVFCEKPFSLSTIEGAALARLATFKNRICQVGYHNRFVASFVEAKRLVDAGVIGRISHIFAESYGAVIMKPKGGSWRTQRAQGGGCLYDYAAHPINLVNWLVGEPTRVSGAVLNPIFSAETDDEVYGTMSFADGVTAQISVNWSDPTVRKMSTKLSMWGSAGKIIVDRQELQMFLRDDAPSLRDGHTAGWTVRNTTELTSPVDFYLRGEEYSAQLWAWIAAIETGTLNCENDFMSAVETDATLEMFIADATSVSGAAIPTPRPEAAPARSLLKRFARG